MRVRKMLWRNDCRTKLEDFHQSNRSMSIKVKETVCRAYADGEINDYEINEKTFWNYGSWFVVKFKC